MAKKIVKSTKPRKKQPLSVKGYTSQSNSSIDAVNTNKLIEETALARIDQMRNDKSLDIDLRWAAIAETYIQIGFMALNRSVFKPVRIK